MSNDMSWTKPRNEFLIIIILSFILYNFVCAIFIVLTHYSPISYDFEYDPNTIRSTYPNYAHDNLDKRLSIFTEYAAPKTSYRSFIGYRREEFKGDAVAIDSMGFRISTNHELQDSVWFFGGSTMWGTGSDDSRTIPSYFASKTGENVLNLGESGYNSLQELIQLQIMISKGFTPKEVIFYDGVNDGYYFCQNDNEDQIRHAYTSRWKNLQNDYDGAIKKLENKSVIDFRPLFFRLSSFYKAPLSYFDNKRKIDEISSTQRSDTPIKSMKVSSKYLHCDQTDFANKAAKITLNAWRSAAAILKQHKIPVWFVIQPTATYKPEKYKIEHIINFKKQAIVNEMDSYRSYYNALKNQVNSTCAQHNDCANFIDLSELFFDIDEYIFIDTCHVSPIGNELITDALLQKLR